MIYIIIPVFNRWHFTKECLDSLEKQTYLDFTIIVIDHGSTDNTSKNILGLFPNVIILKGHNSMWWTAATNIGIEYALQHGASHIITLNNDLTVEPNYIESLLSSYQSYPFNIIGSLSIDINNKEKVFFAGVNWNAWTAKYSSAIELNRSYTQIASDNNVIKSDVLPGRGTLFPSEIFKKIGLFDEKNFPHYMADEDIILRCRKIGYSALVSTSSVTYSHVMETGLNASHTTKNIKYWKDFFTSIRSPNNINYRWKWAKKHGKIPILYFVLDYSRILGSQILKSLR